MIIPILLDDCLLIDQLIKVSITRFVCLLENLLLIITLSHFSENFIRTYSYVG